ncbi:hypothetical protein [Sphingobium aromaticiconvertens]|uniref:hypothetical protein n=1 Tax=Sphingobium aromaticiconvertens TaxID=365341 RepID=UPI0030166C84
MRNSGLTAIIGLIMTLGLANDALAAPPSQPRPEIFVRLLDCRTITDSAARLACYDRQVGAMETASQNDEVVVLDKEELKKTRRSLFGFSLPKLPFLGDNDGDQAEGAQTEFTTIEAKLSAVRNLGYGKWSFRLDDGAEWQTTEAIPTRSPKTGMAIKIKRAAMGSFMGSVNGWPSVRMKRVS